MALAEIQFPKLDVAGSNPVARFAPEILHVPLPVHSRASQTHALPSLATAHQVQHDAPYAYQ